MNASQPPSGIVERYYNSDEAYTWDAANMAATGWRVTYIRRAPDSTIIATYAYGTPTVRSAPQQWMTRDEAFARFMEQTAPMALSVVNILDFANFITDCTLQGAVYAEMLATDGIAPGAYLTSKHAQLPNDAEGQVQAILGVRTARGTNSSGGWLPEDLALVFGANAFMSAFEEWCTNHVKAEYA